MTYLLNCIAATDKTIENIKKNPGQAVDKQEFGLEFGTWNYTAYYEYFSIIGKINKPLDKHVFTEAEKTRIIKQIKKDIETFPKNPRKTQDNKRKTIDKMGKTKYCTCCDKERKPFEHNTYDEHIKLQLHLKMKNILGFNDVKYYKKLLLIFSQKRVEIVTS